MSSRFDDGPWLEIRARGRWLDLRLGELWRYRDLISLFVYRDLASRYKQTILGPLWFLVQPLLTSLVFTVVFGNIARISTDGLPKFLFYMAGGVAWSYFSECLLKSQSTFSANAAVFGKIYFPRLAVPISVLISNLVTFAIQFVLFLGFLGYFAWRGVDININANIVLLPILIALIAGLGLGLGLVISALTTRYRDLSHLVTFAISLAMYATPVVYPLSSVPDKYRLLVLANPLTAIIECLRHAFLGKGYFSIPLLSYAAALTAIVLFGGIVIFHRVERTFMDTI